MAALLNKEVKRKREHLINEITNRGYYKATDGRQLYELNLALKRIYISLKQGSLNRNNRRKKECEEMLLGC